MSRKPTPSSIEDGLKGFRSIVRKGSSEKDKVFTPQQALAVLQEWSTDPDRALLLDQFLNNPHTDIARGVMEARASLNAQGKPTSTDLEVAQKVLDMDPSQANRICGLQFGYESSRTINRINGPDEIMR